MKEHYWYTETEFANYPTCELEWEPEYDCYSLDSKHLKAVWEFCFAENKEDVIPLLKKFVNEHPDFWDELKKGGYEETTIEDIFALDDKKKVLCERRRRKKIQSSLTHIPFHTHNAQRYGSVLGCVRFSTV